MVTGLVLTSNKGKVGLDGVSIPEYFYKIIYDPKGRRKMIAFLIPKEKSTKPPQTYVVSVDSVESLTALIPFLNCQIQWKIPWRIRKTLQGECGNNF